MSSSDDGQSSRRRSQIRMNPLVEHYLRRGRTYVKPGWVTYQLITGPSGKLQGILYVYEDKSTYFDEVTSAG